MSKLLCWFDNNVLEELKDFLIDNKVTPLCADRGIAFNIASKIVEDKKDIIWEYSFENSSPNKCYLDEIISVPKDIDGNYRIWEVKDDAIYGETSTETIKRLVDLGCQNIAFTAYRWHLWRIPIINLNIPMPFSTQLNTWKKLEKLYGKCERRHYLGGVEPEYNYIYEKYSKFNLCWIMLDQTKSFKKLIQWCKDNNKIIGLIAPDNWQQNSSKIHQGLKNFVEVYNE